MTDGTGTTTYVHDANGRVSSITNGANATTTYTYNARGDVVTLGYPAARNVTRQYNNADRLISQTDWLGHTTLFNYDSNGNLISTVYPNGSTVNTSFDPSNAMASTGVTSGGVIVASITYTRNANGLVTQQVDNGAISATTAFAYNTRNELTSSGTETFASDLAGNLTRNGLATQAFDASQRLCWTATNPATAACGTPPAGATTYAYNANGDRLSKTPPTGPQTIYTYDQDDRLTSIGNGTVTVAAAATTSASLPVSPWWLVFATIALIALWAALRRQPRPIARLTVTATALVVCSSLLTACWDGKGSLPPGFTLAPKTTTTTTIAPTTTTTPPTTTTTTIPPTTTTTVPAPPPLAPVSYTYNGDGLRMAQTTNGTTTTFVWDTTTATPKVLTDTNNTYIYGPDGLPLEQIDTTGTVTYFFHDALGTTRALLTTNATIAATFTYTAYGTLTTTTGTTKTPLLYAQSYTDPGTALLYLIDRYYDPTTTQFITTDRALNQTGQPFSYTTNNPINNTDPTGQMTLNSFKNGLKAAGIGLTIAKVLLVSVGLVAAAAAAPEVAAVALAAGAVVTGLGFLVVAANLVASAAPVVNSCLRNLSQCGPEIGNWATTAAIEVAAKRWKTVAVAKHIFGDMSGVVGNDGPWPSTSGPGGCPVGQSSSLAGGLLQGSGALSGANGLHVTF
jgi:RHS repeat-associated protein